MGLYSYEKLSVFQMSLNLSSLTDQPFPQLDRPDAFEFILMDDTQVGVQSCNLALNVIKYPFEDALLMPERDYCYHCQINE